MLVFGNSLFKLFSLFFWLTVKEVNLSGNIGINIMEMNSLNEGLRILKLDGISQPLRQWMKKFLALEELHASSSNLLEVPLWIADMRDLKVNKNTCVIK